MHSLITTISPLDGMYVAGGEAHYFGVGADALKLVRQAMSLTGKKNISSILDLPCGHGRVLRYLKAEFPQASLTACDLDQAAVDFCVATFGARGVYSAADLSQIGIDESFDLVFCGSLLTHLDHSRWVSWLRWFRDHLDEGGLLIFTTHGRLPYRWLAEHRYIYGLEDSEVPGMLAAYRITGFGYRNYPQQRDYGVSISSPGWVVSQVGHVPDLQIVGLFEAGWDRHQDAVTCVKSTNLF